MLCVLIDNILSDCAAAAAAAAGVGGSWDIIGQATSPSSSRSRSSTPSPTLLTADLLSSLAYSPPTYSLDGLPVWRGGGGGGEDISSLYANVSSCTRHTVQKDSLTSVSTLSGPTPSSSSVSVVHAPPPTPNHPHSSSSSTSAAAKRQIPELDDDDDDDEVCVLSVFKKQRMQTLELSQKEGLLSTIDLYVALTKTSSLIV